MRASLSCAVVSLGLVLATWPLAGRAQSDLDFVFADHDGHLLIRFVGAGATGLDPSQTYEVSNAEFSQMVHDRLHADLMFEGEPRDADWAAWMEPQIAEHVVRAGPDFSAIIVECRVASCRAIMEQPLHWTVPKHRAVLETVQQSLEAFIASRRQHFEPGFMITAYYQDYETPHIKVFLRRTERGTTDGLAGG